MGSTTAGRAAALQPGTRIQTLDVLRGLVIVIMALDHVRDFFHNGALTSDPLDPEVTTPLLYLTRWITHLCAPTFVFLAGASIRLQKAKGKTGGALSAFLLKRGLWLLFLESTVMAVAFSFAIPALPFLQVIWAIGCSMIAMSALVRLPERLVLALGVSIIALHNLLDPVKASRFGEWAPAWLALHQQGPVIWHGRIVAFIAYPVLPWLGVMALGYGFGWIFLSPRRNRILAFLGAGMIAAFLALRVLNGYGDPGHWVSRGDPVRTAMAFFNVQKYPPSLMFVCATLGISLLTIPLLDRLPRGISAFLRTFGAVPFAAYVAHFYVVHALSVALHLAAGKDVTPLFNTIVKELTRPEAFQGFGFPLWVVYVAWAVVVALVYPLCKWWGGVRRQRRDWWLSYL